MYNMEAIKIEQSNSSQIQNEEADLFTNTVTTVENEDSMMMGG